MKGPLRRTTLLAAIGLFRLFCMQSKRRPLSFFLCCARIENAAPRLFHVLCTLLTTQTPGALSSLSPSPIPTTATSPAASTYPSWWTSATRSVGWSARCDRSSTSRTRLGEQQEFAAFSRDDCSMLHAPLTFCLDGIGVPRLAVGGRTLTAGAVALLVPQKVQHLLRTCGVGLVSNEARNDFMGGS